MKRDICPNCGVELRIGKTYNTIQNNAPVAVQQLICSNPKCIYNRIGAPVKLIVHNLETGSTPENLKTCCTNLLVKLDEKEYFVPTNVQNEVRSDVLTVTCPSCGKKYSYNVANKVKVE